MRRTTVRLYILLFFCVFFFVFFFFLFLTSFSKHFFEWRNICADQFFRIVVVVTVEQTYSLRLGIESP